MTKGVKVVTPFFVCLYFKTESPINQLGLIIAKKNIKTAVERNRYRRVAKESFRLNQHRFAHYQVVLMARRNDKIPTNDDLFKAIDGFWQKLAHVPSH